MVEITIDTREQTPWSFDSTLAKVSIGTLRTGDYAVTGDTGFAIERKSLDDFLGTISTGWHRFQREVYRARERGFNLPVLVEGRLEHCLFHLDAVADAIVPPAHDHLKLTPQFVLKRIGELAQMGASVMFCECAEYAVAVAYAMLVERNNVLHKDDDDELPRNEDNRKS